MRGRWVPLGRNGEVVDVFRSSNVSPWEALVARNAVGLRRAILFFDVVEQLVNGLAPDLEERRLRPSRIDVRV